MPASVNAQRSTAPSKPMTPATPNAEDTLRRPAPLLLVDELLPEVVAGELAEVPVAAAPPEEPVEAGLEPVPVPLVPVSVTVVLMQEAETPAWTVTMSE